MKSTRALQCMDCPVFAMLGYCPLDVFAAEETRQPAESDAPLSPLQFLLASQAVMQHGVGVSMFPVADDGLLVVRFVD